MFCRLNLQQTISVRQTDNSEGKSIDNWQLFN